MPVLLLFLALVVFAYFFWRARSTTLTRNCRWRFDRNREIWTCAYCGGQVSGSVDKPPTCCVETANRTD
ncbi:hypothetical protein KBY22_05450 [Ruegeria pomeroyi]|nr:hypothetical protein [Ruegeria pomeroyi]MCE8528709.1 hypothetical protein [Ruegeria pomeroyi]